MALQPHFLTPQSVELIWTSDRPVTETSTSQHTTLNRQTSMPRWESNPQSQQASGRRPTPQTARPPGPAEMKISVEYSWHDTDREKNRRTCCVSRPSAAWYTTKLTLPKLGSNPVLRSERSAINCVNLGTAFKAKINLLYIQRFRGNTAGFH